MYAVLRAGVNFLAYRKKHDNPGINLQQLPQTPDPIILLTQV